MKDLYLRFADESESIPFLYDGESPRYRALDVIGPIEEAEGWHVNIRAYPDEPVDALEPFLVFPESPQRVWAPLEAPPPPEPYVPVELPPPLDDA